MVEKAKSLAKTGESVVFIIAFDDYDESRRIKIPISKEDHFLYQDLSVQFEGFPSLKLEFVNIWEVIQRLHHLMEQSISGPEPIHVFVDEFSFWSDRKDDGMGYQAYAQSLILPMASLIRRITFVHVEIYSSFLLKKALTSHLWIAGFHAREITCLKSPDQQLELHLRSSKAISNFVKKRTEDTTIETGDVFAHTHFHHE